MRVSAFYLSLFIVVANFSQAQKEANHWYFGAGLDFSNGAPVPDNNGRPGGNVEGCSAISDKNGNLLFYTYDLDTVYNKLHQPMANGTGMYNNPSSMQASVIFKKPGSGNLYCMFSQNSNSFNQPNSPEGLYYHEIDMSLASGNGSVTVKNFPVTTSTVTGQWEALSAVQHCNGIDYWVLVRDLNPDNLNRAYLVTAAGVSMTPVMTTIGPNKNGIVVGTIKISPSGRKVAAASAGSQRPWIMDFDPATGVLSNVIELDKSGLYMEFSPDGTKLYSNGSDGQNVLLHQWDLCAGTTSAAIINSRFTQTVQSFTTNYLSFGDFQLAPDGKIYVISQANSLPKFVSVINNPNVGGSGCNFTLLSQSSGTRLPKRGLPNFVSSYFKTVSFPAFSHTVGGCNSVMFSAPPFSTVICSAVNPYTGVNWIFGDPNSGAANTSSLTAPSHVYSVPGTYQVKLALLNACAADTIYQTITFVSNNTLQTTPSKTVCLKEKVILTASGGNSYNWSNGATANSITITAQTSSVYVVTSTLTGGCVLSNSISITVSECTGFKELLGSSVRIYPVPANDRVVIEVPGQAVYSITDLTGRVVMQGTLQKGAQELDIALLNAGLYVISLEGQAIQHTTTLVIQRQ